MIRVVDTVAIFDMTGIWQHTLCMEISCKKLWNKTLLFWVNIMLKITFDISINALGFSSTMHITLMNLNQTVEYMYPWYTVNHSDYSEESDIYSQQKIVCSPLEYLIQPIKYIFICKILSWLVWRLYLLVKAGTSWYLLRNSNFFLKF